MSNMKNCRFKETIILRICGRLMEWARYLHEDITVWNGQEVIGGHSIIIGMKARQGHHGEWECCGWEILPCFMNELEMMYGDFEVDFEEGINLYLKEEM